MKKNLTIIGMNVKEIDQIRNCKVCLAAKLPRQPFSTRASKSSEKLQIVYTDVCGPIRTVSNGAKYFITVIDDCSRWCEVLFEIQG